MRTVYQNNLDNISQCSDGSILSDQGWADEHNFFVKQIQDNLDCSVLRVTFAERLQIAVDGAAGIME